MKIDQEKCIGCGACTSSAEELIEIKEGKAVVIKQPETEEEKQKAKEAESICPVEAISAA